MHVKLHRFALFALLIAVLLLLAAPTPAQEATPEPTAIAPPVVVVEPSATYGGLTTVEIVLIVVLLVVIIGAGLFINSVLKHNKELALKLADALPPWAWDALQAGTERGFAELGDYVESTPNTLDDDLFERLQKEKDDFFAEVRADIPKQVTQAFRDAQVAALTPATIPVPLGPPLPPQPPSGSMIR